MCKSQQTENLSPELKLCVLHVLSLSEGDVGASLNLAPDFFRSRGHVPYVAISIEIINNTRGSIHGKIWKRANGGKFKSQVF